MGHEGQEILIKDALVFLFAAGVVVPLLRLGRLPGVIGFVAAGQEAEVKIESFPFTKYGLIDGTVLQVSADAVEDEEQGLIYPARVKLHDKEILVNDRFVPLAPGMSVTAEVKTGDRRVLEFFLSPFLRYQDEALRER